MKKFWQILLLGIGVLAVGVSCKEQADEAGVVKRDGQPDDVTKFDEERIDKAIAEAKSKLGDFVQVMESRSEHATGFSIKKGFKADNGETEYIWVEDVKIVEGGFEGKIGKKPVNNIGVKLGDAVTVATDDVVDWMYMEQSSLRGGYTVVALVYGTPQEAQAERGMGIDWSLYEFLK